MGSLFSLEGKVAIFAGASKETGRTIAIEMAKAGADVVVSARTVEGIENAAAEIRSLGRRSLAVPTDVREAAIDNEPHYRYTPNSLHDRKLRYHSREISGSVKWFSLRRGRMRVLVTGGAGRLGISVCRMLQKKGFEVRVFDLNSERNRKSVKELGSKAEVFWGDITDADSVRQAVEGVDAVIHMAGILPPVTEANPGLAAKVNVGGTKTLVDAIRKREKRIPFVFTSSVAVFGPTTAATEPISVEKNAPDPKDVYGQTKLKAENLIRESGIDYVILRLSAAMYTVFELSDVRRLYGGSLAY